MNKEITPEIMAKINGMSAENIHRTLKSIETVLIARQVTAKGYIENDKPEDLMPLFIDYNNMLKDTLLIF